MCKDRLGKKRGEEEANDILKNDLHPFNDVLERFIPNNDSVEEFNVTPCVGVWIETSNSVQTGWPISSHPAWVYMD